MSDKPARESISKVDTAWLRMEQPTNLMMINGIIILDEGLDYEALLHTVEQRFLAFRRFRQKAVDRARGAYWEIDEDFDLRWHVRRTALPGLADREELELLVSDLASTALLATDKPIHFGVKEFCNKCKLCAEYCPSGAISMADSPEGMRIRGYEHWYINNGACYNFWRESMGPMGCRLCVAVCPYTRKSNWIHRAALKVTADDPTFAVGHQNGGLGGGILDS